MNSDVTLFYWKDLYPSEMNAMKIIKFMGGTVNPVRLAKRGLTCEEPTVKVGECLIISAQTLSEVSTGTQRGLALQRVLMSLASNVLVYGFEEIPLHNQLLKELTSGGLIGVESSRTGDYKFRVTEDFPEICQQFTGLSFGIATSTSIFSFTEGDKQAQFSSLIRIGGKPCFVSRKDERGRLFLLASSQIADLDAKLSKHSSLLQLFPDLAPLMMFMRSASPNRLWQNDKPTACFIIDDPLLKKRYGFLEYQKLFDVMRLKRFSTSIAFIPWNYRRSDRLVVDLFATHPERYSLCIHGCDHTAGEFGGSSHWRLREQGQKALDRMTLQHKISGLSFDDIMVFPQGVFSSVAMKALKSCGYLAAINSTAHANDSSDVITLRDLVDVAVTRYSNFPLFIRRYPVSIIELAFDLFLGKPALLVEHHRYFRDGYHALSEIIDKLNSFDKRIEWTSLGNICSRTCLTRVSGNGDLHVKFFTNRFVMRNDSELPKRYMLFRQQSREDPVTVVTINGCKVDYNQEDNYVTILLSLNPRQAAEVKLHFGKLDPVSVSGGHSLIYSTSVFVRRHLSEFRDNYIDRTQCLRKTAYSVRNLFVRVK